MDLDQFDNKLPRGWYLGKQGATSFHRFMELPAESRNLIWKYSLYGERIITLKVFRNINKSANPHLQVNIGDTKKCKELDFNYLSAAQVPNNGTLVACFESSAIYKKLNPAILRYRKTGCLIRFDPELDTIYVPDVSIFFAHQSYRRLHTAHHPFTGFQLVKKVATAKHPDEQSLRAVRNIVMEHFQDCTEIIEGHLPFDRRTDAWTLAVQDEHRRLSHELGRFRRILLHFNRMVTANGGTVTEIDDP
jgi:hypothetical protein